LLKIKKMFLLFSLLMINLLTNLLPKGIAIRSVSFGLEPAPVVV
jgi:hypothetical protein